MTRVGVLVVLLFASTSAFAQGNSQSHKKPSTPAPPSRNELSAPAVGVGGGGGTAGSTPFAWIDDATLLPEGSMAASLSVMRWNNGDISEVDVPVVAAAVGVAPRLQLSASVPRVAPNNDLGTTGTLGTSFISAKVAVIDDTKRHFKIAVSPTLELLSPGVVEALGMDRRVQFGVPVSAEIDRGSLRLYASSGYFSSGTWFAGAGATMSVNDKVAVSVGLSRAWRGSDLPDIPLGDRDRKEVSGAAAYALTSKVSVFASIGQTFATLDENGAGTSIGAGVSVFLPAVK